MPRKTWSWRHKVQVRLAIERGERTAAQRRAARRRRFRNQRATQHRREPFLLGYLGGQLKAESSQHERARLVRIAVPSRFSFIDAPEEALACIRTVLDAAADERTAQIHFDHSGCNDMEMAANAVLDTIVMLVRDGALNTRRKLTLSGFPPTDPYIQQMFRAAGLVKHLKLKSHELPDSDPYRYLSFPLRRGRRGSVRSGQTSRHEKDTQELAEYFNRCLGTQGHELTLEGLGHIIKGVGETLTNAEEHSGRSEWYLVAYLGRRDGGIGECNIAMFNFGKTIFESLQECKDDTLPRRMDELVSIHEARGFFGPTWDRATLWTLYALQDGVSKYSGRHEGADRGRGTVYMIEFFQQLGQRAQPGGGDTPSMCVLSGSAHFLFDGRYLMREQRVSGGRRRQIAFNATNDLRAPPDPKCVRKLKGFFPGTIIGMRFFLDRTHLKRLS